MVTINQLKKDELIEILEKLGLPKGLADNKSKAWIVGFINKKMQKHNS